MAGGYVRRRIADNRSMESSTPGTPRPETGSDLGHDPTKPVMTLGDLLHSDLVGMWADRKDLDGIFARGTDRKQLARALAAVLEPLVRFVVEAAQPKRIVLYGSAARGEMHANSDIDLLVVMPDGADYRRVAMDLYVLQSRSGFDVGFPVEFKVTTEEIFERRKDTFGMVYYDAHREGRELYASAA